jgi:SET domain-containing protein
VLPMKRNGARGKQSLPFVIRRSRIHGRGAIATRRIPAGTRLIEYAGERISVEEAESRYDDDAMDVHHTFLFEVDPDTYIDANCGGNEARFINHSCNPNCRSFVSRGRVYIETITDVRPGEELTYDYLYKRDGPPSPEWAELYACRCGAPNCRGTMLKSARR